MQIGRIKGATRVLGKSQGYLGLSIRDEAIECTVNGEDTPCMVTAWEPTPDEVERIVAGAQVYLRVLGAAHPPVMLSVGDAPEGGRTGAGDGMRDRLAQALAATYNRHTAAAPWPAWDAVPIHWKALAYAQVDALLAELLTPTTAMQNAGSVARHYRDGTCSEIFAAMIESAREGA